MTLFRYNPHCFSYVNHAVLMLPCSHLHWKSTEVPINTNSTAASLPLKGLVAKQTTVELAIVFLDNASTLDRFNGLE